MCFIIGGQESDHNDSRGTHRVFEQKLDQGKNRYSVLSFPHMQFTYLQKRRNYRDNWGVFFVFFLRSTCSGYLWDSALQNDSNKYPYAMIVCKMWKIISKLPYLPIYTPPNMRLWIMKGKQLWASLTDFWIIRPWSNIHIMSVTELSVYVKYSQPSSYQHFDIVTKLIMATVWMKPILSARWDR